MKCPICKSDLSPLDLVSRTEHVDLCIENGPSIVDINENGQLVIKKNVPPNKQRKICPICDKTFQTVHSHFKTCALKNDLPPNLMLDYWDKINSDSKNNKKFPRDLLDNFVTKCIKEGRVGDQVDFARALSLSMADGDPSHRAQDTTVTPTCNLNLNDNSNSGFASATSTSVQSTDNSNQATLDVNQVLMQNAATHVSSTSNPSTTTSRQTKTRKQKYRLELVDDFTKRTNIELRIERELAATSSKRYQEALKASSECITIDLEDIDPELASETQVRSTSQESSIDILFFRARMKICNKSNECQQGECQGHDIALTIEGFEGFTGKSIFAPPSKRGDICNFVETNPLKPKSSSHDDDSNKQSSESLQSDHEVAGPLRGIDIDTNEDELQANGHLIEFSVDDEDC